MTDFDDQMDALAVLVEHGAVPPMDEIVNASKALNDLLTRKSGRALSRDERRLESKYRATIAKSKDYVTRARDLGLLHTETEMEHRP